MLSGAVGLRIMRDRSEIWQTMRSRNWFHSQGEDSKQKSSINPGDPTNGLGNTVSPSTFSVEKIETRLEQKQKKFETKKSVRNTWRITVLFGALIDRTLGTGKYQHHHPRNASRQG